ncbi:MAG: hypothetical protein KA803_00550 [Rhodoferax sp.]|nr:hypothetical protein [Rhodoferax sp.]
MNAKTCGHELNKLRIRQTNGINRAYNSHRLQSVLGLIFLVPMLFEPGLGTSLIKRDHLALDEPNGQLTSPT